MTDVDDWGVRIPVFVFEKFVVFSDGLEDAVLVVNKLVGVNVVCDETVSLTLRPANKDDPAAEELS